jgi:hypothetical protein
MSVENSGSNEVRKQGKGEARKEGGEEWQTVEWWRALRTSSGLEGLSYRALFGFEETPIERIVPLTPAGWSRAAVSPDGLALQKMAD